MEKIGILVLGNQAPMVLDKVLDSLDGHLFRVFLHVDAKRDLGEYTKAMRNLDRINLVEPRSAVFWGGFSMVEAEMTMIRAALADPELVAFVMLSDDTAPVRRPGVIHAALVSTPDRISAEIREDAQHWYRNFYLPDTSFTTYRNRGWWDRTVELGDLDKLRHLIAARERGKKEIGCIYFSRQWWSLSRQCLEALVSDMDQDEHLVDSFRFCVMPDEIMFPTLFHLRYPGTTTLGVPMFTQFTPHCRTFHNQGEMNEVRLSSEHLFMRKIHPDRADLVDMAATLGDTVAVSVQLSR
jgi:hypothetical protein